MAKAKRKTDYKATYHNGAGDEKMTRVFVYGTLRAGMHNHRWLGQGYDYFGPTRTTKAEFTMLDIGRFPGVILGGDDRIIGEVYGVEPEVFAALDRHEGFPTHYDRIIVLTEDHGPCEMYRYRHPERIQGSEGKVPGGDWVKYWRIKEKAIRQELSGLMSK